MIGLAGLRLLSNFAPEKIILTAAPRPAALPGITEVLPIQATQPRLSTSSIYAYLDFPNGGGNNPSPIFRT